MTKIYDALEKASEERQSDAPSSVNLRMGGPPKPIERTLQSLCQSIEAQVDQQTGKVVVFAGAQPGNDAARLLCQMATVAASRMHRRVLLLASGPFSHCLQVFPSAGVEGWEEAIEGGRPLEELLRPVEENLVLGQLAVSESGLTSGLRSKQLGLTLDGLRKEFDLILIDAPALGPSSEAALLSSVADGVVLVVEARKTRWQVARHALDQVGAQKGKVLGVVLNKRRFYIPGFLYRIL